MFDIRYEYQDFDSRCKSSSSELRVETCQKTIHCIYIFIIYVLLVNLILLYLAEKLFYCVVIPESGVSSTTRCTRITRSGAPVFKTRKFYCTVNTGTVQSDCSIAI